jgi:hypothetical protein
MTQQLINIGSVPNDGTGDTIRVAGNKINQNFTEVYSSLSGIQQYTLPTASTTNLGGVKVDGTTINIANGVISSTGLTSMPIATTSALGSVKPDGISITVTSEGVISTTLPIASSSVLGGVKVDGTTITVTSEGIISAASTGGTVITAASDSTFTNSSTSAASTNWVRGFNVLGFAVGGTPEGDLNWAHYLKLPSWLGSYIIQFGALDVSTGANGTVFTLPIAYSTRFSVTATSTNGSTPSALIDVEPKLTGTPKNSFTIRHDNPGTVSIQWIAIGY